MKLVLDIIILNDNRFASNHKDNLLNSLLVVSINCCWFVFLMIKLVSSVKSVNSHDSLLDAAPQGPRITKAYWKPNYKDLYGNLKSIKRLKCT